MSDFKIDGHVIKLVCTAMTKPADLRFEAMLTAEYERLRCYQSNGGELLVDTDLVDMQAVSYESHAMLHGRPFHPWLPSRDAMFRMNLAKEYERIKMVNIKFQPVWCEVGR